MVIFHSYVKLPEGIIYETVSIIKQRKHILKCCNIVSVDKLRINTQVYRTIIKRWNPTFQPPEKKCWGMGHAHSNNCTAVVASVPDRCLPMDFILNKCRKLAQWSKSLKPESINTKAQFTFQINPVQEDIVEGIQVVMSSKDLSNCMLGGLFWKL